MADKTDKQAFDKAVGKLPKVEIGVDLVGQQPASTTTPPASGQQTEDTASTGQNLPQQPISNENVEDMG